MKVDFLMFVRAALIFVLCAVIAMLTGCAGLDVEWKLQATYTSEELTAKRKAALEEQLQQAERIKALQEAAPGIRSL